MYLDVFEVFIKKYFETFLIMVYLFLFYNLIFSNLFSGNILTIGCSDTNCIEMEQIIMCVFFRNFKTFSTHKNCVNFHYN